MQNCTIEELIVRTQQAQAPIWIAVRKSLFDWETATEEDKRAQRKDGSLFCECEEITLDEDYPDDCRVYACRADQEGYRPMLVLPGGVQWTDEEEVSVACSLMVDHWFRPMQNGFQTKYDYGSPLRIQYEKETRYDWCRATTLRVRPALYNFVILGTSGMIPEKTQTLMAPIVWEMLQQVNNTSGPQSLERDTVLRARGDRRVSYGGGGISVLCYPIWIQNLDQRYCDNFSRQLHALNEQRNDSHEKEPLDDIIDPNLAPGKFENLEALYKFGAPSEKYDDSAFLSATRAVRAFYIRKVLDRKKYLKSVGRWWFPAITGEEDVDDVKESHRLWHMLYEAKKRNHKKKHGDKDEKLPGTLLRQTMHWIPSRVSIDQDDVAHIDSSIHQLPYTPQNKPLYRNFERMLTAALPSLRQMGLGNRNSSLQVIFKVQSYDMRAGMSYKGHWHVEGLSENVVAVISFYPHISPHLTGGSLRFRPSFSPGEYFEEFGTTVDVPVEQGSLVVFSNVLPHRVRRISCNDLPVRGDGIAETYSDTSQRRTVVTAFIVDPLRPLPSYSEQDETVIPMCSSHEEAVAFRAKVRSLLGTEKHGWGFVTYGNYGVTQFQRSASQLEAHATSCWDDCYMMSSTNSSN